MGILGGMFNPPHAGHIELARTALRELGLDRVLLTPASVPPHKPVIWDPGGEQRAQMCRIASREDPGIEVSTVELERPGPSYTVDTLKSIQIDQPDAQLTLILGADMAVTLGSWREPQEIVSLARLAVADREGVSRRQVLEELEPLGGAGRIDFLSMRAHEVSSSQVRRRLTCGQPIDALVGADVAAYIDEQGLYGHTSRTSSVAGGGQ
ncbi:MAG TPA: nicotinate-nucleotide adenylyltransferase [Solirubrobacteraceae bacterium]|nr:nicotinate-nucleotide adenylyltransferase [Solirubrobacteraceae bacterium]